MAASWERLPLEIWAHLAQRQYLSPKFKHLRHVAAVCKAWRNAIFDVICKHYWIAHYGYLRLGLEEHLYSMRSQFETMEPEVKRAFQILMWRHACGVAGYRKASLTKNLQDLSACHRDEHYAGTVCGWQNLSADNNNNNKYCWCVSYGAREWHVNETIYSAILSSYAFKKKYYKQIASVIFL